MTNYFVPKAPRLNDNHVRYSLQIREAATWDLIKNRISLEGFCELDRKISASIVDSHNKAAELSSCDYQAWSNEISHSLAEMLKG